jgi:hypothetical protein
MMAVVELKVADLVADSTLMSPDLVAVLEAVLEAVEALAELEVEPVIGIRGV